MEIGEIHQTPSSPTRLPFMSNNAFLPWIRAIENFDFCCDVNPTPVLGIRRHKDSILLEARQGLLLEEFPSQLEI
jgi:hypothetical protein